MSDKEFRATAEVYSESLHGYRHKMVSVQVPYPENTKVEVIVRPVNPDQMLEVAADWRQMVFNLWQSECAGLSATEEQLKAAFYSLLTRNITPEELDALKEYILMQGIEEGWLKDEYFGGGDE